MRVNGPSVAESLFTPRVRMLPCPLDMLAALGPFRSTIRCVRHMTTSPDKGPVVMVYGCSEFYMGLRPPIDGVQLDISCSDPGGSVPDVLVRANQL
jgi:hypothetical protein